MKLLNMWKAIALALALGLSGTQALAGATNQEPNTAATPGEGSATTKSMEEPDSAGRGSQDMKDKKATTKNKTRKGSSSDSNTTGTDTSSGGESSTGGGYDPSSDMNTGTGSGSTGQ
jgi:hypothetical protein